jgi:hypothetical protein
MGKVIVLEEDDKWITYIPVARWEVLVSQGIWKEAEGAAKNGG